MEYSKVMIIFYDSINYPIDTELNSDDLMKIMIKDGKK